MNEIGKVVHIDRAQLEKDMEGYSKSPKQELLKVFSLDKNGSIEGSMKPTDQNQSEDAVHFSTSVLHEAREELTQDGKQVAALGVDHSHNADSGHDLKLSTQDLIAAKKLKEENGIDHMGLTMNGHTGADGKIAVQHKIIADSDGNLRTLQGDEGEGKVVTMYTDTDGQKKIEYSQSIEEAKALQEIVELKKQLMAA